MNVSSLSPNPSIRAAALAAQIGASGGPSAAQLDADRKLLAGKALNPSSKSPQQATPDDIKKAASQFEAIILRQLLEPSMTPLMSGGLGGSDSGGGGMYGYLLTDVMASSLAQGGGLGWARMLEKQLSPAASRADNLSKP